MNFKRFIITAIIVTTVLLYYEGLCERKENEVMPVENTSIKKVNEFKYDFKCDVYNCKIYWDTITNTYFAWFGNNYSGSGIVDLINTDGSIKEYSSSNKNELVLVEAGDLIVLEDVDTGVQYIINPSTSNYKIRRNSDGTIYNGEVSYE